ncbi:MAG: hypothetical protein ACI4WU_00865 [Bacilli bacterium]
MINKITIKNGVKIINDEYVKKKKKREIDNIYNYLLSRSFDYFPEVLNEDDEYIYYRYINDIDEPREQKMVDLVNLVSLLHNKTTFYKEVDIDNYKYIYESISKEIDDTYSYYNIVMDNIESEVYMSPSNYLIARNITIIYNALRYSKRNIDRWYKMIENSRKLRVVMTHNNLSLDHYLKNDRPYLISFDRARIDMPLNDLVSLYKKHYLDFEFSDLFKIYLSKYPLSESEMMLFLTIISIPDKIPNNDSEYMRVLSIRRIIDYVYKTADLVAEYGIKEKTNE